MRIAELAERSGVSVRNIRFYHQVGVLPRPRLQGRSGWYGEEHLRRLQFVRQLQERGYSLAAIADMINAQVPEGLDGAPDLQVGRDELDALVPALAGRDDLVDGTLVRLGVLRPAGPGRYDVTEPSLLRAGLALLARGVPLEVVLGQLERLRAELGVIAERFAGIIEHDLLPGAAAQGRTPAEASRDVLEDVLPAVLVATGTVLREALQAAVRRRLPVDPPPGGSPGRS
jgi:DNA-binding transcriptional MerR regulator